MRKSGILMHISSLPSPYGIGTMGRHAYDFVDFLHDSGQQYWQILPIGPTSYGDSPYQSFSTFAGNPYFIDFDLLRVQGLLELSDYESIDWGGDPERVDYPKLFENRFKVLKKAFARGWGQNSEAIGVFYEEQKSWLEGYAEYMAFKYEFDLVPWTEWAEEIRMRDPEAIKKWKVTLKDEMHFWVYVQYLFFQQWYALKAYANQKGVEIIGDIPIYVAQDSADVWVNPELFWLDEALLPVRVAGCPPDAFSATGQLWGNPLYHWDAHRKSGYRWWIDRVKASVTIYDVVRIDHFRGFESYYTIPYGDKTAEKGSWKKGPGIALFEAIREELGEVRVIAEDLGYLTDEVRELLAKSGFPGMKVLEFAFDSREASDYLPHNYGKNCIVYTGTHDNDTIGGWFQTAPPEDVQFCADYLNFGGRERPIWTFIRSAWASTGDVAITQMQDFLELGSEARMNTPSTLGDNWQWRANRWYLSQELCNKIRTLTKMYGRLKEEIKPENTEIEAEPKLETEKTKEALAEKTTESVPVRPVSGAKRKKSKKSKRSKKS